MPTKRLTVIHANFWTGLGMGMGGALVITAFGKVVTNIINTCKNKDKKETTTDEPVAESTSEN